MLANKPQNDQTPRLVFKSLISENFTFLQGHQLKQKHQFPYKEALLET